MTWVETRLKYLCTNSGQYGLNVAADQYSTAGTRLIRTSDISEMGTLKPEEDGVYVDQTVEERHRLQQGDLLLSRSGTLGRSFLVPNDGSGATYAGFLVKFRPRSDVEPRFLFYASISSNFRDAIHSEAVSSTIQNFNAERYANIPLMAPELREQRRIADFLDTETTRVDRLVAARERQLTVFEERIFAETSATLVPGSLTAPLGQWPWTWLPRIPRDRPLIRLGYVCRLQNGLTVDGKRDVSGDVLTRPYLRVANVQAGRLALGTVTEITVSRAIAERSTLRPGDVLMTEGGDIDKLGRGTVWGGELDDCLHQNHIFAIRPNNRWLDGEYLALMTQSMHGRCYFESTGVKTTNLASTNSSKILGFPIPLPSVKEQRAIVRDLRARTEFSTHVMAKLERQLNLLAERRQALITAAVTGQLDVTTARGGESQ